MRKHFFTIYNAPRITCLLGCFILVSLAFLHQGYAQDSLVIRNVEIISQEDTAGLNVSLIIIDHRLELVTTDSIETLNDAIIYEGNHGFLIGQIVLGKRPSFVILKENPRANFDVFLNSKNYINFAMQEGKITINRLKRVRQNKEKSKQKRLTWTAYNPPLMAVPFNYYSAKKWNRFSTKYVSGLFNGIMALDRMMWLTQDDESKNQVGELTSSSLGEIRAIRFGLIGTLNFKKPWVYTIFITNNTFDRDYSLDKPTFTIYDFRVDIPVFKGTTMSIGKQKEPISLSRLTTLVFLPMQERQASADAFLPARNLGIVFNNSYLNKRGTWAIGAFKNFIESGVSFAQTPLQLTARATNVPYLSKDKSNLLHLGIGLRYSDARQPVVARTESEFYLSPVFIETPTLTLHNFFTCDFELYWRKGPFLVGGEFIGNSVPDVNKSNTWLYGYKLTGAWSLTGEMRPYRKRSGLFDPLPVSKPVNQGGGGALELAVRYSTINVNQSNIDGGKMDTYSAGINWWLSSRAQFSCNYRLISLNRIALAGLSSGMNLRFMMILD